MTSNQPAPKDPEFLSDLLKNGVVIRLDEATIRDLFLYRIKIQEHQEHLAPLPSIPELARHSIRKWIGTHPISTKNKEGVANE